MASISRILPLVIASALFMEQMDSTIIATALPDIAKDLGTSPVSLKLAFTTYLLGMTVFLPISGWMADRYGAKMVFRLAIIVFTAGSVACGFANGLHWLVAARGLQGAGGAMMVPVGRIILLRTIPKSELVDAMAWLTIPALIGPTLGPPVGGFIATYFDWRYIFWMNLPFGILALALATWLMPDMRSDKPPPLDTKGFILSGLGLTLAVFGGTVIGRGLFAGWQVAAMISAGFLLLAAYVAHARRAANPILDLKLLRVTTYRLSIMGGNLFRIAVGATPFLLPLMLQIGFGMNAFHSGIVTCASTFGAFLMKFTVARFIRRFGFRDLLVVNSFFCCLSIAAAGFFTSTTPILVMMGVLLVAGFLRSLQFTSLNALAYSDIATADMARANPLYTVMQQLSLAIGVAVAAAILDVELWWAGREQLLAKDFAWDLIVVSAISGAAFFAFLRLPLGAGSSVSGKIPSGS
jgi:EmrB/QacA subfamily drug resistance transporter